MPIIRKSIKEQQIQQRRKRRQPRENERQPLFCKEHLIYLSVVFSFVILTITICFVGVSPAGPSIINNQIARSRVVADISFSYISEIDTAATAEATKQKIPPVYRLDKNTYEHFSEYIIRLSKELESYVSIPGIEDNKDAVVRKDLIQTTTEEMQDFLQEFDPNDTYSLDPNDLVLLANNTNGNERSELLQEGLRVLNDLYNEGVYDPQTTTIERNTRLSFFNIEQESGHIKRVEIQSLEDALRYLRINISALNAKRSVSAAIFRILRNGLEPNLVFDRAKTDQITTQAIQSLQPKVVNVSEGTTIIEPNQRVNDRSLEMYKAYRKALSETPTDELKTSGRFLEQIFLTLIITVAASLYVKIRSKEMLKTPRLVCLQALVIIFNLAIIRLILNINDASSVEQSSSTLAAILPWFAPVALAPIVITVILGSSSGILASCLVSIFFALMQGNSIVIMLSSFLCGITSVYLCRSVQQRARLVRAGIFSGLVMSICAFFLGIRDTLEITLIFEQMLIAAAIGLATGITVVGLLPILENLFRYTTDITLLELTDFNHPLLRQMQVSAPGSYHHSLMVANLAENAASAIKANPLVCRVCALYHDIGKMVKPEYFTENQRDGLNPHIERNPSMSALIIKAHVKEGSIMARQNKLPQIIIDVIKEHHGTSLIQYFYYKALEQQRNLVPASNLPSEDIRVDLTEVNESTYRYEGPIPHFKESAIIMLADSLEAASRSLRKVTPQSIDELINRIVQDRIDDGQLDNVNITLKEIAGIKESFAFSILNMLHSRVEYPTKDSARKKSKAPMPVVEVPKEDTSTEKSSTKEETQEPGKRNIKHA
ncbi:MAG: HDIG domain-containing protein [Opitutales bacterium]|nr:HDIG domain-containing protein [Opitutales bacterium]